MPAAQAFLGLLGAPASVCDEVKRLESIRAGLTVIAPANPKGVEGIPEKSITSLLTILSHEIRKIGGETSARFILSFHTDQVTTPLWLSEALKLAAWPLRLPLNLRTQPRQTRLAIQEKLEDALSSIHLVYGQCSGMRAKSAVCLPLVNYQADDIIRRVKSIPEGGSAETTQTALKQLKQQLLPRWAKEKLGHKDDRSFCFCGCDPKAHHGVPHPTGNSDVCYIGGKFRLGAALFPGFHYEAYGKHEKLTGIFKTCSGDDRNVTNERLGYINVFPNDHLLPEKV